ncbi:MAG: GNAT family N-acetyltransferase [Chthoniobacterales bacterium]|nr:GNAT family N-acetyltransferase [Chthoniobacterales bacterium]
MHTPPDFGSGAIALIEPTTEADLASYFDLRWRVLREPWQQPPGSERDDRENESIHLMVRAPNGDAFAAGRLHLNSPTEAQVRFMAVDPKVQSRGLGSLVLGGLEERARDAGARRLILNARASALRFYEKHGYRVEAPAERLFHGVDHWRMSKDL